ncbi:putative fatty acyl-CoA reductase CG5065 isoform X1 [Euwallacea fornicatus]|uniref:putative fatty acyl-CoA reductase CG5065 isoform X1 n=1 Tax=Euwallacea fornicatus TaxID=995702 RepID=UPI00339058F4
MAQELNRITATFNNKTVFISGATGFLGKVLIEKLLRCTEVKTLYLLVRPKANKCPKDRLQEMFNHVLFARLREERPLSLEKCEVISGDVMETDLGISDVDRRILENEVDYIFHSAATTRFDHTLQYAVKMNTLGTKYMLDLARQCKKLKIFVHVSTCFAFPKEEVLYEKTYEPPMNPQEALNIFCFGQSKIDDNWAKRYLGEYTNTYAFSKALSEGLVNQEMDKLPVIIVRPAVVIPTFKEPFAGYFNSLQSPMGIFVGAGKGVIRSTHMDSKTNASVVPVDCTINVTLVAVWDYLTLKQQRVFNISIPQEDLKISWEEIINHGKEACTKVPFTQLLWYPNGIMTKSKSWHMLHVVLFQLIPAVFVDLLLILLGYKPILVNVNQRLLKGQQIFDYYTNRAWTFDMKYFINVRKRLTKTEKETYQIEAENIDITAYLVECMLYSRRHIFKEADETLPAARRKLKIFFVLDRAVKIAFFALIFYYIIKVIFF